MITSDLDAELVRSLQAMADAGDLPEGPLPAPGRSWRPDPDGDPASYATSLPLELAPLTDRTAVELATKLATALRAVPWIADVQPSDVGYLRITVTDLALAGLARRIVRSGPGCARSRIQAGTAAESLPWPDPAAARTWPQAWEEQVAAMTGHLAAAAGACISPGGERATRRPQPAAPAQSPVAAAVIYFGVSAVRYRLARTLPGRLRELEQPMRPGADLLEAVQLAHAEAASTLRWAGDLHVASRDPGEQLAAALSHPAERRLLGLLSWLPVRVASAARRQRPSDLPRYLEEVARAWTVSRQSCPALPFGGSAAPAEAGITGGRLLLAGAVRTVLATGLELTGIAARTRI